jgi:hypothetical protein
MSFSGPASADIRNYTIGKGIASFKKTGESLFRDLGNVPAFEFTPTAETLDHFSSRTGVKSKDRSVVVSTEGELKITMEEFTVENLALALMGNIDEDSSERPVIDILQNSSITGEVKFVGTNSVGQQFTWLFNNVSFIPSSTVSPLSDEWGTFEVTGQVLVDSGGKFGTVTHTGGEGYENSSSSS